MGHLVNLLWTCRSYIPNSWNSWPEFLWIVRRGQKKWWKHVLSVKLGAVYFNRPGRVMERKLLAMFARLGFSGKTKQNCSPAIFTSIKRIGPLYWKSSKSLIETADTDASIANGDCKSFPSPRPMFAFPWPLKFTPESLQWTPLRHRNIAEGQHYGPMSSHHPRLPNISTIKDSFYHTLPQTSMESMYWNIMLITNNKLIAFINNPLFPFFFFN